MVNIPKSDRPLRNVETFGQTVRGLREEAKGTDIEKDVDAALEKRGHLKDGKLQGKAAE